MTPHSAAHGVAENTESTAPTPSIKTALERRREGKPVEKTEGKQIVIPMSGVGALTLVPLITLLGTWFASKTDMDALRLTLQEVRSELREIRLERKADHEDIIRLKAWREGWRTFGPSAPEGVK